MNCQVNLRGEGWDKLQLETLLILSRWVHDNSKDSLEHEGQQEVDLFDRQVVGGTGPSIAQLRLATGSAGVQFRAFTDHDASRIAFIRAVPLHGPCLRHRGRVLRASRVGKAFYLQYENFVYLSLLGHYCIKKYNFTLEESSNKIKNYSFYQKNILLRIFSLFKKNYLEVILRIYL